MNINIYNPYVRDELYHHGILGMKWGKRNGPPYPLGASDHSASEKKAGWRKSLNKSSSGNGGGRSSKRAKSAKVKSNNKSIGKAIKRKLDSITPEQKAYAKKVAATALKVAGAIAITALAIYGIKTLNTNALKSLHKAFAEGGALAAARNERENRYIADFVGRTGYQRMLDMRDRHPNSRVAARAVQSAWNQHMKNVDETLRIARRANRAGNKFSYYSDPSINPLKKVGSQIVDRLIY